MQAPFVEISVTMKIPASAVVAMGETLTSFRDICASEMSKKIESELPKGSELTVGANVVLNHAMTEQLIMEENGKRYRMLMAGETLDEGDEVDSNFGIYGRRWVIVSRHCFAYGFKISHPILNASWPQGYYRRPIAR